MVRVANSIWPVCDIPHRLPTEELLTLAQPSSRRFTSEARPIRPFPVGPLFLSPPAPARSLSHPLQVRVQIWTARKIEPPDGRCPKPAATVRPAGLFCFTIGSGAQK